MNVYVWIDNKVVNLGGYDEISDETKFKLAGYFLFDTGRRSIAWQYGKWNREDGDGTWRHVDKSEFPKEFLTTLLIMGVA